MDKSNHRPPNPGVVILIVLPILGPLLVGACLHLLAGVGIVVALLIGYVACIIAAPPLAFLANRVSTHRQSRRSRLLAHVQPNGTHMATGSAQATSRDLR